MSKYKNKRLTLRNFKIRYIDQRCEESSSFVRVHGSCDLTSDLTEQMGWEVLAGGRVASGIDGAKLAGELATEEVAFRLNGQKTSDTPALECPVTRIEKFVLARFDGETEGVRETEIRFVMVSTHWKLFTEFYGETGGRDGVLTVILSPIQPGKEDERQMKIGEEASGSAEESEEAEDSEEAEEEEEAPALASKESRVVNGGRNLVSHRQKRDGRRRVAEDIEAPAVQMEKIQ